MRRVILATISGAAASLLLAVIGNVLVVDIPARQRGEILDPPIDVILAVTVIGAICSGLSAYKWGHVKFPEIVRYVAVGALLGVLCATISGLAISNIVPLWRAGDFKVMWLKTMVPVAAAIGTLGACGYYLLKQRNRKTKTRQESKSP